MTIREGWNALLDFDWSTLPWSQMGLLLLAGLGFIAVLGIVQMIDMVWFEERRMEKAREKLEEKGERTGEDHRSRKPLRWLLFVLVVVMLVSFL